MRRVMVRYKVKPEHAQRNAELVRAVYTQLQREETAGIRYATFKLDDGVTFVHLAETKDGANPLGTLAAFAEFQSDIAARCDEPPQVAELEEIGSYRADEFANVSSS
jgi:hypothetical protein